MWSHLANVTRTVRRPDFFLSPNPPSQDKVTLRRPVDQLNAQPLPPPQVSCAAHAGDPKDSDNLSDKVGSSSFHASIFSASSACGQVLHAAGVFNSSTVVRE